MFGTIIQSHAGNCTFVKGMKPVDIEPLLADAKRECTAFVYLHPEGQPHNSIAVAPEHVVALILSE
jgi:hypothetical protein